MYKATQLLTSYKDIISTLPQEKIMKSYLGTSEGSICSPFRVDNKPGCTFYYGNDNILYLRDWAINEKYHCIGVIMKMEDCNFQQAINIAKEKFGVKKSGAGLTYRKTSVLLQAVTDRWNDEARAYWAQYNIDHKTLRKFGVRNVKYVYRNKALVARATSANPIFVYTFKGTDKIKIYRPLAVGKQYKWLGNVDKTTLNGEAQLPKRGKLLIITSSLKDVMVLYKMGFSAIAPQSENSNVHDIQDFAARFDKIVVFFDADEPGLAAASHLSESIGAPYFTIPSRYDAKDISDCVAKWGFNKSYKIVKRKLSRLFKIDDLPF